MSITTTDVINLIKSENLSNLTEKQKQEYVDAILTVLKNEQTYLEHYPIFEYGNNKDFPNDPGTSLFKELNNLIDLDGITEEDFNNYFTGLIQNRNNLWNESLKNILNIFYDYFYKDEDKIIPIKDLPEEAEKFKVSDIKNANAGKSFNGTPWVHKNTNIEGESYDDVRGNDKIESVLNKRNRLQFTHHQTDDDITNKYIRLLMPKYVRRVEVEDLNRNFWVIGQTITGISAYLFDDDSPIKKMFKYLSSEIIQLWENLIYLWALLKILSIRPPYETKCLVVYVPNDTQNNQLKYDNFGESPAANLQGAGTRLKYLIDQYPNCNLLVLPIVRKGNYWHNYYTQEHYYGVLKYNRETKENKEWDLIPFDSTVIYNISNYSSRLAGARMLNAETIRYIDFKKISDEQTPPTPVDDEKSLYFCAVRVIPAIELNNDSQIAVSFQAIDAYVNKIQGLTPLDEGLSLIYNGTSWTRSSVTNHPSQLPTSFTDGLVNSNKSAVYLGEVISNFSISKKKVTPEPMPSQEGGFKVFNIGSFFPQDLVDRYNIDNNLNRTIINFQLPVLDPVKRFNTDTYGYGAFLHYNQSGPAFKTYIPTPNHFTPTTSNTEVLLFQRNERCREGQNVLDNDSCTYSRICELGEGNFSTIMKAWGKSYLEKLLNKENNCYRNQPSSFELDCGIYISRIGVGYWEGYHGTVWNNGIFCDLFAIFINKEGNKEVQHICPLYLFDGYWTNNPSIFTYANGSQWRQLKMTVPDGNVIITPNQDDTYTFELLNGTLSWQDHNKDIVGNIELQSNRPHCKFEFSNNVLSFTNYSLGKYSSSGADPLKMTSKLNSSSPINTVYTYNGKYYNFESGGAESLVGCYDWGTFRFT